MDGASSPADEIQVAELELFARVGVTESERAQPQRLTLNMTVWPVESFENLHDDLAKATDYAEICAMAREFVAQRTDRLIETLASALAAKLLHSFTIRKVRLELRKFVLPEVKHVAVVVTRMAEG